MSHEIDMSNGRANIAFIGEVPWHTLGEVMTEGASIDQWIASAGLGFTVDKAPLFAQIEGIGSNVPNGAAIYRKDTKKILGICSKSHHKLVQPREIVDFFADLLKETSFTLEVAGSLKGGKRVWALARCNMELDLNGDVMRPYLLISTAYDNQRATVVQFTMIRVVCNNTISMAYEEHEKDRVNARGGKIEDKVTKKFYVRVPHNKIFNPEAIKAELNLVTEASKQFMLKAKSLSERKVSREEAVNYVEFLFAKYDKNGEMTKQSMKVCAGVVEAIEKSPGADLETAKGTAWGLLNGVTNFLDFKARSRSDDNRLNSAWFGDAAKLKLKAMEKALQLAA